MFATGGESSDEERKPARDPGTPPDDAPAPGGVPDEAGSSPGGVPGDDAPAPPGGPDGHAAAPGGKGRRLAVSTAFYSAATALSRVMGLVREIYAASLFGVRGPRSDWVMSETLLLLSVFSVMSWSMN